MLQALKQQQQQQQQWDKGQSTSPRRLQQSPKKDSEVGFVRSSFLLFTIFSPSPTSFLFSPFLFPLVWSTISETSSQAVELPETEVKVHSSHHPPTVCVWSRQQVWASNRLAISTAYHYCSLFRDISFLYDVPEDQKGKEQVCFLFPISVCSSPCLMIIEGASSLPDP